MNQQDVLKEDATVRVFNKDGTLLSPCTIKRARKLVYRQCAVWLDGGDIRLLVNKYDRKALRKSAAERSNRVCYICQEKIPEGQPVTLDHITPKSDGGRDEESNAGCACKRCNDDKSNVDLIDYIEQMKQQAERYPYMTERKISNLEMFAADFYSRKQAEEVGV